MDIGWMVAIFRKRFWIGFAAFVVVIASAGVHYSMQPRIYHCAFTIRLMTDELPADMKRFEAMLLPTASSLDSLINVIQSDKVLQDALRGSGYGSNLIADADRRALAGSLRASLKITPDRQANMITVLVAREDAKITFDLTKALKESVLKEEVQSRLQKDEDAKTGSVDRSKQLTAKLSKLDLARGRLEKANQHEQTVTLKRGERAALVKELEQEIGRLAAERTRLELAYTEDWPELRAVCRRMDLVRTYLREEGVEAVPAPAPASPAPAPDPKPAEGVAAPAPAAAVPAAAPAAAAAPGAAVEGADAEDTYLKAWGEKGQQLIRVRRETEEALANLDAELIASWREEPKFFDLTALNHEMDMYRQALDSEERNRLTLDSKIATTVSNLRVMEEPLLPSSPASPNPRTTAAAALALASILAVVTCYAKEHLDPALRTIESIQHYTHQQVLALIPYIDTETTKEGYPCRMAYARSGEGSPGCDPYRILKTNIEYAVAPMSNPVLLVTSATREEGKSTTAINLTFAFAEERKILYISSNLRRPTGHLFFEKSNETGLVDILEGKFPWQEGVQHTQVPNLHVITSGRIVDNSAVLLNRPIFQTLLDEARKKYDVIVLDSPPVLLVTDAMVLAPRTDAVILVYAVGQTDKQNLVRAIEILGRTKAKLIGIAANAKHAAEVPNRRLYYYSYYPS